MAQKILVVEDDPAQLRYLETIVANLGYETLAASDGDAAVDLLIRQDRSGVDLVLLDLVLPKLDGFG
ncbi:MAG: response regulator, partial [Alphaproteobacteria bacterium]|nr:response regulator [Alphaproteobacteria bacterium]